MHGHYWTNVCNNLDLNNINEEDTEKDTLEYMYVVTFNEVCEYKIKGKYCNTNLRTS